MPLLRYGVHSVLRFEGSAIAECPVPRGEPLSDVAAAVTRALAQPMSFPPLAAAVVPGDRVALAVEPDVPQVVEFIDAVVNQLAGAGVQPADVTVVLAAHDRVAAAILNSAFAGREACPTVEVHDSGDRSKLAYLSATREGEAVYLNRLLCDADLVLPIGVARIEAANSKPVAGRGLYPIFSDTKAQQQAADAATGGRSKSREKKPADMPPNVHWMLGVQCIVQVVPGPGDSVLAVLAGDPVAVEEQGHRQCIEAWSFRLPQRSSLVVAAVEGGAMQQTWSNLARAVTAAVEVVAVDGAIALCCDVDSTPGPGMQALGESGDRAAALRRIRKQHLNDAAIAEQFAKAFDGARVYLLSRLDETVVEELGMAPVASGEEIERLARRHNSCLLLSNAQRVVATVDEAKSQAGG